MKKIMLLLLSLVLLSSFVTAYDFNYITNATASQTNMPQVATYSITNLNDGDFTLDANGATYSNTINNITTNYYELTFDDNYTINRIFVGRSSDSTGFQTGGGAGYGYYWTVYVGSTNITSGARSTDTFSIVNPGDDINVSVANIVTDYIRLEFTGLATNLNPFITEMGAYGSTIIVNPFEIGANSFWDNSSITIFNATINGTTYSATNGTIITPFNQSQALEFNITISSGEWFNETIKHNISINLNKSLKQTQINITFKFSSGDIVTTPINLTSYDTGVFFNVTGGSDIIFPNAGLNNFSASCDNEIFAPFNFTLNVTALDNLTYVFVVNETQTVLTFLDANSSNPIVNATIFITFPSGNITNRTTNSSGKINFSYIYNGSLEFGVYNFIFSKIGYINISIDEDINASSIPFTKTYNISRAKLNIYIYDRVTRLLLSGVNVSVAFIGLFNETTTTGTIIKDNLTIIGGNYLVYAGSDGYKTSVRSLTFTNQEEFTLNFYLLNLSVSNYGILFVTTFDSFYRNIGGAKVELLEYVPNSLSYVSVAECVSNIDAQCSFGVELNTKVYYIRATAIIDGILYVAETNQNGEIFTVNGDNRDLTFYTSDTFNVDPSSSLMYDISETFISNVSSISNSFYSLDGNAYTVCIEYFKDGVSVTGDTHCLSSTSALQNVDVNMLLNRSNDYRADIYIKTDNGNILLDRYVYPSVEGISAVLGNVIVGAIIIVLWVLALGFCIYSSNMVLWFSISLVLAWLQVIFFPNSSIISFAVFKSVISVLCLLVARKKRDIR